MATLIRRTLPFLSHPRQTHFRHFPFSTSSQPPPPAEPWAAILRPNFTPTDLTKALTSTQDPDLAWALFRWATNSRHFTHTPSLYQTMLEIALSHNRPKITLSLLHLTLQGPLPPNLPLYNTLLKYTSSRPSLFATSFQIYKKLHDPHCSYSNPSSTAPDLETYRLLFKALIKKFNKTGPVTPTLHVYLKSVKSLQKRMRQSGVVPDTYVMNMIIKANCRCLNMDEAVRVVREMGLYNCEANEFSYSYLVVGFCEKGRVGEGVRWYREMRGKGLVGTSKGSMVLACALAVEGRCEEAVEVVREMVMAGKSPDVLTYRTVLEEMCRRGLGAEAMEVLEEFKGRDARMGEKIYRVLLDCLHFRK